MRICAVDSAPDRERDKGAFWKGNWNISSGHIAYHGGCTGSHDEKEFMEIFGRNYLDPVEIGENSEKENEPV